MGEIFVFLFLFGYLCRRKKRGMWDTRGRSKEEGGRRKEKCSIFNDQYTTYNVK